VSDNLWRAESEFTVSRRIPWDNDEGLRPHIDRVVDAFRGNKATAEVEVDADLESAHVILSVIVAVPEDGDGDSVAREHIAGAIRECGARHEGLLPLIDESRLEIRSGLFPGLRMPLWTFFRMTGDRVVPD
jgi:hypothetical protein